MNKKNAKNRPINRSTSNCDIKKHFTLHYLKLQSDTFVG